VVEAKKRNPSILLYGLPWVWPGWVAPGVGTPFENVTAAVEYVVAWVAGAASTYNLTIDSLGIWNERPYNATYVKALRAALDVAGFQHTAIVCDDGGYECVADMLNDPELDAAVSIIGGHGPPPADAYTLGKPLWFTEDYHALVRYGDASSWAYQINQRYLQTNCTSVLAWNALDAFYSGMYYDNSGLMVSRWPWSGHYEVLAPIWATAHTTQFSRAGWRYLPNNTGGGLPALGGSYVTLVDGASAAGPTAAPTWSIIIEKLCGYFYSVCTAEEATFCVDGGLLPATGSNLSLYQWTSVFRGGDGTNDSYLIRSPTPILLSTAAPCFPVIIDTNSMVTVTTTLWGGRGQHPPPPPAMSFPLQYEDDFSSCVPPAEAPLFADITGAYECAASTAVASGVVMRQRTPAPPISWDRDTRPHGVIGDITWADVNVTVDALFPADVAPTSLMLAVQCALPLHR
jgi:galactosylceramidase